MTRLEPRVADLLDRHGWTGDPRSLIRMLCRDLLDVAGTEVPVDLSIAASVQNVIRIDEVRQIEAAHLRWDGEHYVISVREQDSVGRRRFSAAHDIVHTFFEDEESGEHRHVVHNELHRHTDTVDEESLCDFGAAELCMPYDYVAPRISAIPTMDDIQDLASTLLVSLEAAANRVASLVPHPAACVVFEPSYTAAQKRAVRTARSEDVLPGMPTPELPSQELRVAWSRGHSIGFIPKNKSAKGLHLMSLVDGETENIVARSGLTKEDPLVHVSALRAPYRRGADYVDRVIALIIDPNRTRSIDGFLQPLGPERSSPNQDQDRNLSAQG